MKPTNNSPWISAAAVRRDTGISRRALEALQGSGVIRDEDGRIHADDLVTLKGWLATRYVCGKDNVDFARPFGFAVPLTDPTLSPDLNLSDSNDRARARAGLMEHGLSMSGDQILSGWWSCREDMAAQLVATRAPLLGVTGGFVVSGAWIDAVAQTHWQSLRKAFLATRMTAVELEGFRGVVPRVNQSGTYVQLP